MRPSFDRARLRKRTRECIVRIAPRKTGRVQSGPGLRTGSVTIVAQAGTGRVWRALRFSYHSLALSAVTSDSSKSRKYLELYLAGPRVTLALATGININAYIQSYSNPLPTHFLLNAYLWYRQTTKRINHNEIHTCIRLGHHFWG